MAASSAGIGKGNHLLTWRHHHHLESFCRSVLVPTIAAGLKPTEASSAGATIHTGKPRRQQETSYKSAPAALTFVELKPVAKLPAGAAMNTASPDRPTASSWKSAPVPTTVAVWISTVRFYAGAAISTGKPLRPRLALSTSHHILDPQTSRGG